MANKYYAVRVGRVPGVYTVWSECQENINGYPGAIYKSFSTKEEAERFINNDNNASIDESEEAIARVYSNSEAIAYVDGCYNDIKGEYAYGVVMFYEGRELHFAEKFSNKGMVEMCNVAGEIEGAKRAMKFCLENQINSIDIIYDYEGIEKWCTGAWRTNKIGTQEYKKYYNRINKTTHVNFVKVKSHSGNKYNELADQLAKSALGIDSSVSKISGFSDGIVANGIKYDDLLPILDLLKEDFNDLVCSKRDIAYGEQFILEIKEPTNQRLTINCFKEKNKIVIQGRKEDLFNQLSLCIIELLENEEIPKFLNTVHNLEIDIDVVECEFNSYFSNSCKLLPKEIGNYLRQAVYNLHIAGNMYITNFLVEPALRSLEAILKVALLDHDIPIRKEERDYDSFFVFEKKNGRYVLKEEFKKETHTSEFLKYLTESYTYFHEYRHTLSHWDNPKADVDTTRILNTVEEAQTIIKDVIQLIDKYYTL